MAKWLNQWGMMRATQTKNSKAEEERWRQQTKPISHMQLISKMCMQNHLTFFNIHELQWMFATYFKA